MAAAGITAAVNAATGSSSAVPLASSSSASSGSVVDERERLRQRYVKGAVTIGAGILFAYIPFRMVTKMVVRFFGNSSAEVAGLEGGAAALRRLPWRQRVVRWASFSNVPSVASMETLFGVQTLPKRFLYLGNTPIEHRVAYTSLSLDQMSRATMGHAHEAGARALAVATAGVASLGVSAVFLAYFGFGITSADKLSAAISHRMPWSDELTSKSRAFVASVSNK